MNKWYNNVGNDSDVVFSSRIRLARNLEGYPFPNKMSLQQKCEVIQKISDVLMSKDSPYHDKFRFYDMDKISHIEALSMVERHLISPDFAENGQGRALLINDDETISIMINEEDHLRIQVLKAGFDFDEVYKIADEFDRFFEMHLKFAFNDKLGYLTECPTNLGTGMRASAMLHVPALESIGALGQLSGTISKIGLTMRGTFGEGSKIIGSMYQISNQITLGISEKSAIENLAGIIKQIEARERQARNELDHDHLEDVVFRSYGILKNARLISGEEFLEHASNVRLGVGMGIITETDMAKINSLIIECQAASLQQKAGGTLDSDARDKLRARTVREGL